MSTTRLPPVIEDTRYPVDGILRSEGDDFSYGIIKLPNGLECLLISDTNATMEAAAMAVGVGGLSDPAGLCGLAHLVGRYLFLGSHKVSHSCLFYSLPSTTRY